MKVMKDVKDMSLLFGEFSIASSAARRAEARL
jgi:hypothetical protein